MAMAEVVNQPNDVELLSNMLVSNQENSLQPLHHEPLVNTKYPLGNAEGEYLSPVSSCEDVDKDLENMVVGDDITTSGDPLCDKSPLYNDSLYNVNNNDCKQVHNEEHSLEPNNLHMEMENAKDVQKYVRDNFYTHTDEQRNVSQQAYENLNTENNRNNSEDHADSPVNFQQFKSTEGSVRRYAWGENQPRYLQNKGYNSDGDMHSDMHKNSTRNKKSSWDDPPCESYEERPEFRNQFVKSHRRVKSGDSFAMYNVNSSSLYQSFSTPENIVHHSQSQGNIRMPPYEQKLPVLSHQSISVDASCTNRDLIHQHLCLQSTTFVRLQAAIAQASKEAEKLEQEVDAKFHELNAGLNVKQNPTHRECQTLEEEVRHLTKEIQDMYNECDNLGVSVPDEPPPPLDNTRLYDLYPGYQYPGTPSVYPISPIIDQPVTVQPSQTPKQKPKGTYENVLTYKMKNEPTGCKLITAPPPPIPPRIPVKPVSEHWACPRCTFKNLLVSDCEVCCAPRPTSLH